MRVACVTRRRSGFFQFSPFFFFVLRSPLHLRTVNFLSPAVGTFRICASSEDVLRFPLLLPAALIAIRECATPLGQGNILEGLRVHRPGRARLSLCSPALRRSEAVVRACVRRSLLNRNIFCLISFTTRELNTCVYVWTLALFVACALSADYTG